MPSVDLPAADVGDLGRSYDGGDVIVGARTTLAHLDRSRKGGGVTDAHEGIPAAVVYTERCSAPSCWACRR